MAFGLGLRSGLFSHLAGIAGMAAGAGDGGQTTILRSSRPRRRWRSTRRSSCRRQQDFRIGSAGDITFPAGSVVLGYGLIASPRLRRFVFGADSRVCNIAFQTNQDRPIISLVSKDRVFLWDVKSATEGRVGGAGQGLAGRRFIPLPRVRLYARNLALMRRNRRDGIGCVARGATITRSAALCHRLPWTATRGRAFLAPRRAETARASRRWQRQSLHVQRSRDNHARQGRFATPMRSTTISNGLDVVTFSTASILSASTSAADSRRMSRRRVVHDTTRRAWAWIHQRRFVEHHAVCCRRRQGTMYAGWDEHYLRRALQRWSRWFGRRAWMMPTPEAQGKASSPADHHRHRRDGQDAAVSRAA